MRRRESEKRREDPADIVQFLIAPPDQQVGDSCMTSARYEPQGVERSPHRGGVRACEHVARNVWMPTEVG